MSLHMIDEYVRILDETFGSPLAVAAHQSSSTHLVVNISPGDASAVETIDQDYLPTDPLYVPVTNAGNQSTAPVCHACNEDDAFTEWAEDAELRDVDALAEEIWGKLVEADVTDALVAAWEI